MERDIKENALRRRPALTRSVITLSARLPFVCWINALPKAESSLRPLIDRKLGAYLIPKAECSEDRALLLAEHAERIFEQELLRWWPAEFKWPQERNILTLESWFDVACHAIATDVADEPLLTA